ncbi:MAG: hypothetical protein J1E05_05560 [Eubacterium sp.]|nr:hypothetical protein [Eubacterium sp.]
MKKFVSLFTEIIMVLVILCSSSLPALADEKWPVIEDPKEVLTYINGVKSNDVIEDYEISPDSHHYRYWGGGTVTGWEFPTLTEGVDYEILSRGTDDIEFKLLNGKDIVPYINVLVDFEHWPIRTNVQDITAYTNTTRPGHVTVTYTPASEGFRLEYTAEGSVTGWEFPNMTEGKNYEVIAQKDNYIDIKLINGQDEIPYVNVLVDYSNPKGNDNDKDQAANENENSITADATNGEVKTDNINSVIENTENDMDSTALIYVAAGVCAVAAVVVISIVVKKHKKNA